ncbi:hypothetical protein [Enterovibrio norvegicus]|uniref:Uncharacterized protein n=1 Tax=Enterovibrio norvegicus TaxID=188144 RepID=A0A2N7LH44_9GAMM|nr:hypothetical protein [Enterovibrio norvegicus]PMN94898.1 hypothetical protein BCT23_02375 [Enterovibrio norvegicus]
MSVPIELNQNRKHLSEDYDKANVFVNDGYATSSDVIIEFSLDAQQYAQFRNQIIPKNGASTNLEVSPLTGNYGRERTVFNTEGLGDLNGRVKNFNGVELPQRGHGDADGLCVSS